jgi:hypothetical protein
VCRAEQAQATADDYATGPGQIDDLRSLFEWDLNLTLLIMISDERSSLGSADEFETRSYLPDRLLSVIQR